MAEPAEVATAAQVGGEVAAVAVAMRTLLQAPVVEEQSGILATTAGVAIVVGEATVRRGAAMGVGDVRTVGIPTGMAPAFVILI